MFHDTKEANFAPQPKVVELLAQGAEAETKSSQKLAEFDDVRVALDAEAQRFEEALADNNGARNETQPLAAKLRGRLAQAKETTTQHMDRIQTERHVLAGALQNLKEELLSNPEAQLEPQTKVYEMLERLAREEERAAQLISEIQSEAAAIVADSQSLQQEVNDKDVAKCGLPPECGVRGCGALEEDAAAQPATEVSLRSDSLTDAVLQFLQGLHATNSVSGSQPTLDELFKPVERAEEAIFQHVLGLEAKGVALGAQIGRLHQELRENEDTEHQRQPKADELLEHSAQADVKAVQKMAELETERDAITCAIQGLNEELGACIEPQPEKEGLFVRVGRVVERAAHEVGDLVTDNHWSGAAVHEQPRNLSTQFEPPPRVREFIDYVVQASETVNDKVAELQSERDALAVEIQSFNAQVEETTVQSVAQLKSECHALAAHVQSLEEELRGNAAAETRVSELLERVAQAEDTAAQKATEVEHLAATVDELLQQLQTEQHAPQEHDVDDLLMRLTRAEDASAMLSLQHESERSALFRDTDELNGKVEVQSDTVHHKLDDVIQTVSREVQVPEDHDEMHKYGLDPENPLAKIHTCGSDRDELEAEIKRLQQELHAREESGQLFGDVEESLRRAQEAEARTAKMEEQLESLRVDHLEHDAQRDFTVTLMTERLERAEEQASQFARELDHARSRIEAEGETDAAGHDPVGGKSSQDVESSVILAAVTKRAEDAEQLVSLLEKELGALRLYQQPAIPDLELSQPDLELQHFLCDETSANPPDTPTRQLQELTKNLEEADQKVHALEKELQLAVEAEVERVCQIEKLTSRAGESDRKLSVMAEEMDASHDAALAEDAERSQQMKKLSQRALDAEVHADSLSKELEELKLKIIQGEADRKMHMRRASSAERRASKLAQEIDAFGPTRLEEDAQLVDEWSQRVLEANEYAETLARDLKAAMQNIAEYEAERIGFVRRAEEAERQALALAHELDATGTRGTEDGVTCVVLWEEWSKRVEDAEERAQSLLKQLEAAKQRIVELVSRELDADEESEDDEIVRVEMATRAAKAEHRVSVLIQDVDSLHAKNAAEEQERNKQMQNWARRVEKAESRAEDLARELDAKQKSAEDGPDRANLLKRAEEAERQVSALEQKLEDRASERVADDQQRDSQLEELSRRTDHAERHAQHLSSELEALKEKHLQVEGSCEEFRSRAEEAEQQVSALTRQMEISGASSEEPVLQLRVMTERVEASALHAEQLSRELAAVRQRAAEDSADRQQLINRAEVAEQRVSDLAHKMDASGARRRVEDAERTSQLQELSSRAKSAEMNADALTKQLESVKARHLAQNSESGALLKATQRAEAAEHEVTRLATAMDNQRAQLSDGQRSLLQRAESAEQAAGRLSRDLEAAREALTTQQGEVTEVVEGLRAQRLKDAEQLAALIQRAEKAELATNHFSAELETLMSDMPKQVPDDFDELRKRLEVSEADLLLAKQKLEQYEEALAAKAGSESHMMEAMWTASKELQVKMKDQIAKMQEDRACQADQPISWCSGDAATPNRSSRNVSRATSQQTNNSSSPTLSRAQQRLQQTGSKHSRYGEALGNKQHATQSLGRSVTTTVTTAPTALCRSVSPQPRGQVPRTPSAAGSLITSPLPVRAGHSPLTPNSLGSARAGVTPCRLQSFSRMPSQHTMGFASPSGNLRQQRV